MKPPSFFIVGELLCLVRPFFFFFFFVIYLFFMSDDDI